MEAPVGELHLLIALLHAGPLNSSHLPVSSNDSVSDHVTRVPLSGGSNGLFPYPCSGFFVLVNFNNNYAVFDKIFLLEIFLVQFKTESVFVGYEMFIKN